MDVMFRELPCFGEVGMVMEDSDVGRRPFVPWSDLCTPFGKGSVCKPHLMEQVLLAAMQPM